MSQPGASNSFFKLVVKWRVALCWLVAVPSLYFIRPNIWCVFAGLWLMVLGALVRAWSSATLVKNEVLSTKGPYELSRNPLYVGNILLIFGGTVATGNWIIVAFAAPVMLLIFNMLVRDEEAFLSGIYGQEYLDYMAKVPRFWPKFDHWPEPYPFDIRRLLRKHREWQVWFALVVYQALLIYLCTRPEK